MRPDFQEMGEGHLSSTYIGIRIRRHRRILIIFQSDERTISLSCGSGIASDSKEEYRPWSNGSPIVNTKF